MADSGLHEIMPKADYDPNEAKFCACLFWLVFHATEDEDFDDIPPEITCPTERDSEAGFHVRQNVAFFLCKGTIYMKVCSSVCHSDSINTIWDVIQNLSKEGFYIIDANDEAVTEERLDQNDEFDLDAHLAMMDTLMMAHVSQSVELQQIVSAVSSFASFNAAKELPFDLEDALLLWLNKVNYSNERRVKKVRSPDASGNTSAGRFRFKRNQVLEKSWTLFPKLDDLQADVSNGKALLSLLLFYCPEALTYEAIKSSDPMSQNDIICNVDLFRELCAQHVCTSVFALRTEDLIHKAPELKNNLIALLSEIFIKVEVEKVSVHVVDNSGNDTSQGCMNGDASRGENSFAEECRGDAMVHAKENLDPNDPGVTKSTARVGCSETNSKTDSKTNLRSNESEKVIDADSSDQDDAVKQHAKEDNVDRSIQDKLQKLKSLSSMRKENESRGKGDAVVIQEASWEAKGKAGKDSSARAEGTASSSSMVTSRQPLLSKRSKKQLMAMGNEERSSSLEDITGVQLVDFDLKRSHSLTSVIGKSNYAMDPSKSFKAWGDGKASDELTKSNSQKISLDFKPDTKTYRRQTPTAKLKDHVDVDAVHEDRVLSPSSKYHGAGKLQRDEFSFAYDQYLEEATEASQLKDTKIRNESKSMERSRLSDDTKNFRAEILKRTQREDEGKEVIVDFEEPQFEDDDLFSAGPFISSSIPKNNASSNTLGHGQSPRPNKLIGIDPRSNPVRIQALNDEHYKEHDDDLSPIAEASEPSTPTVYSFQTERSFDGSEISRTIGTDDDMLSPLDDWQSSLAIESLDVTPLNSIQGIDSSGLFCSGSAEPHFHFTHKDDEAKDDAANEKGQDDRTSLKSSSVIPSVSYTILNSEMSIDAAKAAGLPIIGSKSDLGEVVPSSFDSAIFSYNARLNVESKKEINAEDDGEKGVEYVQTVWKGSESGDKITNGNGFESSADLSYLGYNGSENDAGQETQRIDAYEGTSLPTAASTVHRSTKKKTGSWNHSSSEWVVDAAEKEILTDRLGSDSIQRRSDTVGSNWSWMQSEVKGDDSKNEFVLNKPHSMDDDAINTEKVDLLRDVPTKISRDCQSTVTWSELETAKDSLLENLKSPGRDKNQSISAFSDAPIINWAEYARNKDSHDNSRESEVSYVGERPWRSIQRPNKGRKKKAKG